MNEAVEAGDLASMISLHKEGHEWDEDTFCFAAGHGHLHICKYLHEHGCKWNTHTIANAALYGHFDCLQYLHTHGCPWDDNATEWAAEGGHLDCLEYLLTCGCPYHFAGILVHFPNYIDQIDLEQTWIRNFLFKYMHTSWMSENLIRKCQEHLKLIEKVKQIVCFELTNILSIGVIQFCLQSYF